MEKSENILGTMARPVIQIGQLLRGGYLEFPRESAGLLQQALARFAHHANIYVSFKADAQLGDHTRTVVFPFSSVEGIEGMQPREKVCGQLIHAFNLKSHR